MAWKSLSLLTFSRLAVSSAARFLLKSPMVLSDWLCIIQGVDSIYDLIWARGADGTVFTYGDVFLENEREFSAYNFEIADTDLLFGEFESLRG